MSYSESVPYPKEGQTITFLDPFPRIDFDWGNKQTYYIHANIVNGSGKLVTDKLIRIKKKQQVQVIKWLLVMDKKLTQATVKCMPSKIFFVMQRSPQTDFFDQVQTDKFDCDKIAR